MAQRKKDSIDRAIKTEQDARALRLRQSAAVASGGGHHLQQYSTAGGGSIIDLPDEPNIIFGPGLQASDIGAPYNATYVDVVQGAKLQVPVDLSQLTTPDASLASFDWLSSGPLFSDSGTNYIYSLLQANASFTTSATIPHGTNIGTFPSSVVGPYTGTRNNRIRPTSLLTAILDFDNGGNVKPVGTLSIQSGVIIVYTNDSNPLPVRPPGAGGYRIQTTTYVPV